MIYFKVIFKKGETTTKTPKEVFHNEDIQTVSYDLTPARNLAGVSVRI